MEKPMLSQSPERDVLLTQSQGPAFKPILRAIALVVVETFLFTQVAWSADWKNDPHRNYSIFKENKETEAKELLKQKNLANEEKRKGRVDEPLSTGVSHVVLAQVASRPLEEPSRPIKLAQVSSVETPQTQNILPEGATYTCMAIGCPGSPDPKSPFHPLVPTTTPVSGAAEEPLIRAFAPFLIDSGYEKEPSASFGGLDSFSGARHAFGLQSLKEFLVEAEKADRGELPADILKVLEQLIASGKIKSPVLAALIQRYLKKVHSVSSENIVSHDTPALDHEGPQVHNNDAGQPPQTPADDPPTEEPPAEPPVISEGHGTITGTVYDGHGHIVSTYTGTLTFKYTMINGRLVILEESRTYHYKNADGTTGEKTVTKTYDVDANGRRTGQTTKTERDGYIPNDETHKLEHFDHKVETQWSKIERDDQGRITHFESSYDNGVTSTHYILDVTKFDARGNRAEWKESTTTTRDATGESLTVETTGRATTFNEAGVATGFHVESHVTGSGMSPAEIERLRPQLEALASALSNLYGFIQNKQSDLKAGNLSEQDKTKLDQLIAAVSGAIGNIEHLGDIPLVLNSMVDGVKSVIAAMQDPTNGLSRHEQTGTRWVGDGDNEVEQTYTYYTYGIGEKQLTNFIAFLQPTAGALTPASLSTRTDYTTVTEISNIQFDAHGEWASFNQTNRLIGTARLSNGQVVHYDQLVKIDQQGRLDPATGLLVDATVKITTTDYIKQREGKPESEWRKVETLNRSDFNYEQGLEIGEKFLVWATIVEKLKTVFGITSQTFQNGILDAQAFVDRLGLKLNIHDIIGTLPANVTPDQIDQIVFSILSSFIFAALGGGLSNQEMINSAVKAGSSVYDGRIDTLGLDITWVTLQLLNPFLSAGARQKLRDKKEQLQGERNGLIQAKSAFESAVRPIVERLATAIFSHLSEFKTQGASHTALLSFLKEAGVKGVLTSAVATRRLIGYHETTQTQGSPKIEEHSISFEYDSQGRVKKKVDGVYEHADEIFKDTALYTPYAEFMNALDTYVQNGAGRHNRNRNDLEAKFNAFRDAVIRMYGSVAAAPTQVRDLITRFEGAVAGDWGHFTVGAASALNTWADAHNLTNVQIRTKDFRYTVTQDNFKFDSSNRVVGYHEKRIGIDHEGNPNPSLTVDIDATISYDASGHIASQTFKYAYSGGGLPENAPREVTRSDFIYDGITGYAIGWKEETIDLAGSKTTKVVSDVVYNPVTGQIVSMKEDTDFHGMQPNTVRFQFNMQYDIRGNLIHSEGFENGTYFSNQYTYNRLGQIGSVVNQDGHVSNMVYNVHGQLVTYDFLPASGATKSVFVTIEYDAYGKKTRETSHAYIDGKIDGKKVKGFQDTVTHYQYDTFGRLTLKTADTYFEGKVGSRKVKTWDKDRWTYTYDKNGKQEEHYDKDYHDANHREEIHKGFWEKLVHFLLPAGLIFDAIAKLFDWAGLKGVGNFIRKYMNVLQLLVITILCIVAAPFTGGASLLLNALFVAVLTGAAAFAMNWSSGMPFWKALKAFGQGLLISMVTFWAGGVLGGLLKGLEAVVGAVAGEVMSAISRDLDAVISLVTKVSKLIGTGLRYIKIGIIWLMKAIRDAAKAVSKFMGTVSSIKGALGAIVRTIRDFVLSVTAKAIEKYTNKQKWSDFWQFTALFAFGGLGGNARSAIDNLVLPKITEFLKFHENIGYAAAAAYAFSFMSDLMHQLGSRMHDYVFSFLEILHLMVQAVANFALSDFAEHLQGTKSTLSVAQQALVSFIRQVVMPYVVDKVEAVVVKVATVIRALVQSVIHGFNSVLSIGWTRNNVTEKAGVYATEETVTYKNFWHAVIGRVIRGDPSRPGRTITYPRDVKDEEGTILIPAGTVDSYHYDSNGRLSEGGRVTPTHSQLLFRNGYDAKGQLAWSVQFNPQLQKFIKITYGPKERIEGLFIGEVKFDEHGFKEFVASADYNGTGQYARYDYQGDNLQGITYFSSTGATVKAVVENGHLTNLLDSQGATILRTTPEVAKALGDLASLPVNQLQVQPGMGFIFFKKDGKVLATLGLAEGFKAESVPFLFPYGGVVLLPRVTETSVPVLAFNFSGEHNLPTQFVIDGHLVSASATDLPMKFADGTVLKGQDGTPLYFSKVRIDVGEGGISSLRMNGVEVVKGTLDLYFNPSGQISFVEMDQTRPSITIGGNTFYARLPDDNRLYTVANGTLKPLQGYHFETVKLAEALKTIGLEKAALPSSFQVGDLNRDVEVLVKDGKIITIDGGLISVSYDDQGKMNYQFRNDESIYAFQTIDEKESLVAVARVRTMTLEELQNSGIAPTFAKHLDEQGYGFMDHFQVIFNLTDQGEKISSIRSAYSARLEDGRSVEAGQALADLSTLRDADGKEFQVYSFPEGSPLFSAEGKNHLYRVKDGEFVSYGSSQVVAIGALLAMKGSTLTAADLEKFGIQKDAKVRAIFVGDSGNERLSLVQGLEPGQAFQISVAYTSAKDEKGAEQPRRIVVFSRALKDKSIEVHLLVYNAHTGGKLIYGSYHDSNSKVVVEGKRAVTHYQDFDYEHHTQRTVRGEAYMTEEGELQVRNGVVIAISTSFESGKKIVTTQTDTFKEGVQVGLRIESPTQKIEISIGKGGSIENQAGVITVQNGRVVVSNLNEQLKKWTTTTYEGEKIVLGNKEIQVYSGTMATDDFIIHFAASGQFVDLAFRDAAATEDFKKFEKDVLHSFSPNGRVDASELSSYLGAIKEKLSALLLNSFSYAPGAETIDQKLEALGTLFSYMGIFSFGMSEAQKGELAESFKAYVRYKINYVREGVNERNPLLSGGAYAFNGGEETYHELTSLLGLADEEFNGGHMLHASQLVDLAQRFDMIQEVATQLGHVEGNYRGFIEKLLLAQIGEFKMHGQKNEALMVELDLAYFKEHGALPNGFEAHLQGGSAASSLLAVQAVFGNYAPAQALILGAFNEIRTNLTTILAGEEEPLERVLSSTSRAVQRFYDKGALNGVALLRLAQDHGIVELVENKRYLANAGEDSPIMITDQWANAVTIYNLNGKFDQFIYHVDPGRQLNQAELQRAMEDGGVTANLGENLGGTQGIQSVDEAVAPRLPSGAALPLPPGWGAYMTGVALKFWAGIRGFFGKDSSELWTEAEYLTQGGMNLFTDSLNRLLRFLEPPPSLMALGANVYAGAYLPYFVVDLLAMTALIFVQTPEFIGKLVQALGAVQFGHDYQKLGQLGGEFKTMVVNLVSRFVPGSLFNPVRGLAEIGAFVLAAYLSGGLLKGVKAPVAVEGVAEAVVRPKLGLFGQLFSEGFDWAVAGTRWAGKSGVGLAQRFAATLENFAKRNPFSGQWAPEWAVGKGAGLGFAASLIPPVLHTAAFFLLAWAGPALFGAVRHDEKQGATLFAGVLAFGLASSVARGIASPAAGLAVREFRAMAEVRFWRALERGPLSKITEMLNKRPDLNEVLNGRAKEIQETAPDGVNALAKAEGLSVEDAAFLLVTRDYVKEVQAKGAELAARLDVAFFIRIMDLFVGEDKAVEFLAGRKDSPVSVARDIKTGKLQFIVDAQRVLKLDGARKVTDPATKGEVWVLDLDAARRTTEDIRSRLDLSPDPAHPDKYTNEQYLLNRAFQAAEESLLKEIIGQDGQIDPGKLAAVAIGKFYVLMQNQLAFAVEAFGRAGADLEGHALPPAVIQLIQSHGKTSAFALTALALLDRAKVRGEEIRLGIVTSKHRLVGQYLEDPFIKIIKKEGYGVKRITGREAKSVDFNALQEHLIIMDNAAFKSLGLEFIKFAEEYKDPISGLTFEELTQERTAVQKSIDSGELSPSEKAAHEARLKVLKETEERFNKVFDAHSIRRFGHIFADEPQEMLADPNLQEAIAPSLRHLSREERAMFRARSKAQIKIFARVLDILEKAGLIRVKDRKIETVGDAHKEGRGIISATIKNREVRNRLALVERLLQKIKNEFAGDPDVARLQGVSTSMAHLGSAEIEEIANTALNILLGKIKDRNHYRMKVTEDKHGNIQVDYEVAHEGEALEHTRFGDKNIGAQVVARRYLENYLERFGSLDRLRDPNGRLDVNLVVRGLESLKGNVLRDMTRSLVHEEVRSVTTLQTFALVGLEKITAGTGTAGGVRRTLRGAGFEVIELTEEPNLVKVGGKVRLFVVGKDGAAGKTHATIEEDFGAGSRVVLVNGVDNTEVGDAAAYSKRDFGARAIVIDAAKLEEVLRELKLKTGLEDGPSIQAAIEAFLAKPENAGRDIVLVDLSEFSEAGKGYVLSALEGTIGNALDKSKEGNRKVVVFGTRLATGLNTLSIRGDAKDYHSASLIQLGISRADDLHQFAGRGGTILDQIIFHRADLLHLSVVVDFERQGSLLESEKAGFRAPQTPDEQMALFETIQRRMQSEVDDMNVVQLARMSEGQRGKAAAAFEFMKRLAGKADVYHSQGRDEAHKDFGVFLELKTLGDFRQALLALAPGETASIEALVKFIASRPNLVEDGAFTEQGHQFLSLVDLIIDTHTLQDLRSELDANGAITVGAGRPALSVSGLSPDALRDHALDFVTLALDRFLRSGFDVLDLHVAVQSLRYALQSSLDEAQSQLFERPPVGASVEEDANYIPLLGEEHVRKFIENFRAEIQKGKSPHLAADWFRRFYLRTLRKQLSRTTNSYERGQIRQRIKAIQAVARSLDETPPANDHDVMRRVSQVTAQFPETSSRELFAVLYPFMTLSLRLRYADYLDREVEVLGEFRSLSDPRLGTLLPELAIETLQELKVQGPFTLVKFGNKVGIFTTLNQAPVTVFSTERGVGVQVGFSPLLFEKVRNEDGSVDIRPLADEVKEVLLDDVPKPVREALIKRGYQGSTIRVALVGSRVFYLKPNSREISYEQEIYRSPEPSLLADVAEVAKRSLGEDITLSPTEAIRFDVEYQDGRPDIAHVYSGERHLFSVSLVNTTVSDGPEKDRFTQAGSDADQAVVVAQFLDKEGAVLSTTVPNLITKKVQPLLLEIPILMRAGMSYIPVSQLVQFQGTLLGKMAKYQMPLRPVIINFDDRHSLLDRNSQPTVEVEANGGDIPYLNIHPAFLERSYRFAGWDPHVPMTMDGVAAEAYQFAAQRNRGYIHEAIGHLRINPETGQYFIQTDEAIAESLSGGVDRLVFDPEVGQYRWLDALKNAGPQKRVYSPVAKGFVTLAEARVLHEQRFGNRVNAYDGDAALNQAVRLVDFLIVNQSIDRFNADKIRKRVDQFVYQSSHDYEFMIRDRALYNEVKRLVVLLARAYFDALDEVRKRTMTPGISSILAMQGAAGGSVPPDPRLWPHVARMIAGLYPILPLADDDTREKARKADMSSALRQAFSILFGNGPVDEEAAKAHLSQMQETLTPADYKTLVALANEVYTNAVAVQSTRILSVIDQAQDREELHRLLGEREMTFSGDDRETVVTLPEALGREIHILDSPDAAVNAASLSNYEALAALGDHPVTPPYTIRHASDGASRKLPQASGVPSEQRESRDGGAHFTVIEMARVPSATTILKDFVAQGNIRGAASYLQKFIGLYQGLHEATGRFIDSSATDLLGSVGWYQGRAVLTRPAHLTQDSSEMSRSQATLAARLAQNLTNQLGEQAKPLIPLVRMMIAPPVPAPTTFTTPRGTYTLETLTVKRFEELLPRLVAVEAANNGEGHSRIWDEKTFRQNFTGHRGVGETSQVVLDQKGEVAGFIMNYHGADNSLYMDWLTIHPDHQGLDLAQTLVRASAEAAARAGLQKIEAHALQTNVAEQKLYEAFGMTQVSLETNFSDGKPRYLYQGETETVLAKTEQPAVAATAARDGGAAVARTIALEQLLTVSVPAIAALGPMPLEMVLASSVSMALVGVGLNVTARMPFKNMVKGFVRDVTLHTVAFGSLQDTSTVQQATGEMRAWGAWSQTHAAGVLSSIKQWWDQPARTPTVSDADRLTLLREIAARGVPAALSAIEREEARRRMSPVSARDGGVAVMETPAVSATTARTQHYQEEIPAEYVASEMSGYPVAIWEKTLKEFHPEDRTLLMQDIEKGRIRFSEGHFKEAVMNGRVTPEEFARLLRFMRRALAAGVVDAIHVNGIQETDIPQLKQNIAKLNTVTFPPLAGLENGKEQEYLGQALKMLENDLSTHLFVDEKGQGVSALLNVKLQESLVGGL